MRSLQILSAFLLVIICSCKTPQPINRTTIVFQDYQINNKQKVDSSLIKMIQPYGDSVRLIMNKVIGFSLQAMYKKQPESPLGNFMTDALRVMLEKKFDLKTDGALVNYGGVRGSLPKGDITVGNVYELMPFDNVIVVLQLSAKQLQELLDLTADRLGWPISGITYQIKDKKATNVRIGGKLIQPDQKYMIALPDYVANGGDDATLLKGLPQINKGYLMRDAYIEYIQLLSKEGKPVTANIENRITNGN